MLGAAEPGRGRAVAGLPGAVADWYALEGAEELVPGLTPLDELRPEEGRLRVTATHHVRLDEGDDPPVYSGGERISASFTNFVFDVAATARLDAVRRGLWLEAEGPLPEGPPAGLTAGPATSDEQVEVRRYYGPHELVTARWVPGSATAGWHLEADSARRLRELAHELGFAAALPARRGLPARFRRR